LKVIYCLTFRSCLLQARLFSSTVNSSGHWSFSLSKAVRHEGE